MNMYNRVSNYNDIPPMSAIKMNGFYIANLKTSQYSNGEKYKQRETKLSSTIHYIQSIDGIEKIIPEKKEIESYELDGKAITIEEYNKVAHKENDYYDLDMDEYEYPDLETEITVRTNAEKMRKATPKHKVTPEKYEPVLIDIIGEAIDTGSDFIKTPYQLGRAFFNKDDGLFEVNAREVSIDEWGVLSSKFKDNKFENSDHSHLEYAKVDGTYIFTKIKGEIGVSNKGHALRVFNKLSDAENYEVSIRNKIRTPVLAKIDKTPASDITKGEFYGFLSEILSTVNELQVKSKSSSKSYYLREKIGKKIKEIGEQIK